MTTHAAQTPWRTDTSYGGMSEPAARASWEAAQRKPTPTSDVNVVSVVWPALDEAAYYGLAGDVVRTISPHTEADPVAILIQVLIYFGNLVGRSPHFRVGADDHRANLFGVLVGESSKGRKGTSGSWARSVM